MLGGTQEDIVMVAGEAVPLSSVTVGGEDRSNMTDAELCDLFWQAE